jgi:hypothetical protein
MTGYYDGYISIAVVDWRIFSVVNKAQVLEDKNKDAYYLQLYFLIHVEKFVPNGILNLLAFVEFFPQLS